MPTLITHAAVGAGLATFGGSKRPAFWLAMVAVAALPDADALGLSWGIPYGSFFGHRGFFHSLFFAVISSLAAAALVWRISKPQRRLVIWACLLLAAALHPLLDAMTDGGLGIALFSPWDRTRYFLPWQPIAVAPVRIEDFFTAWGAAVMRSEVKWVWLPGLVLLVMGHGLIVAFRQVQSRAARAGRPPTAEPPTHPMPETTTRRK